MHNSLCSLYGGDGATLSGQEDAAEEMREVTEEIEKIGGTIKPPICFCTCI